MWVSILGPLTIVGPRSTIRVTAPRQQAVLGVLLWNANHLIPIDRLVDALWGESPPATARSQVHICVSVIRKRLARGGLYGLIDTQPPGYRAVIGRDQLDLHVFDRLVASGRKLLASEQTEQAAERFAEALRLWGGRPFAGVDSDRVESITAQIEERRLSAVEEYFDLQLELGRSAAMIGELMAQVEAYPFRERLRAQQIVALCRAGRQAEALRAYREARTFLADELGLEPGGELRQLEHDILAGLCV